MEVRSWLGKLWVGQIRGSGVGASVFIAVVLALWVWIRQTGVAAPESFTAYLVWVYILLAAVVVIALLAGAAVRIIFLRIRNNTATRTY